jgi:hypothetical protein
MAQKVQIGDILEVPTKKGLAYVQFSHYHEPPPHMGAVIRVLPGLFLERPKDFQSLASQKELYYTLFPVKAAVNRNIFSIAGHAAVPLHAKDFPVLRSAQIDPKTGKYCNNWWLWDGTKSWRVDTLTDEQLDLSFKTGWNDIALIERIESGWTPRHAEAFIQAARLRKRIQEVSADNTQAVKSVRHFILFKSKSLAEQAKKLAEDHHFGAEIIDNGSGFSLVVRQSAPLTEEYVEHVTVQLLEIAKKAGGMYDAWETAL